MKKFDRLYKKTKNGSIQEWKIVVSEFETGNHAIIIIHQGKLGGKLQRYDENITEGKQQRTPYEQAELEAQSRWNKKKDEGYKSLSDLSIENLGTDGNKNAYRYNNTISHDLFNILIQALPEDRTDASGVLKPMKCTPIEKGLKKIKFPAYAQPKLDGVRGFIRWDGEQWKATSSSGKSYDVMAKHILDELNTNTVGLLTEFILDGEFYKHGTPLEYLSGWARTERAIPEHKEMKFHLFDVGCKQNMVDRQSIISHYNEQNCFDFNTIEIVQTEAVYNIEEFNALHDKWVSEGYEGAILRNADGIYEFGIRSTSIFKKKDFKDEEFEIVGMELGLRGTEDMVFQCITNDKGIMFKANPVGNRALKDKYWNEQLQIIGKQAMVRYLTMSQNGIPQGNPIMKTIRDYE